MEPNFDAELKDDAAKIKENLNNVRYDLEGVLGEMQENFLNYAKDNPLHVMGFSLLAGVVLAQVFKSRKK